MSWRSARPRSRRAPPRSAPGRPRRHRLDHAEHTQPRAARGAGQPKATAHSLRRPAARRRAHRGRRHRDAGATAGFARPVEARQTASLTALEQSDDGKVKRMRGRAGQFNAATRGATEGVSGPFVPYRLASVTTPFEAPAASDRDYPRRGRQARAHAGAARPGQRRARPELAVWRAHRSVPQPARDAHRHRFPPRNRRAGPRHTSGTVTSAGWSGDDGRMVEVAAVSRLATATCRRSPSRSGRASRSGRSSAGSAGPIRTSSCAPA